MKKTFKYLVLLLPIAWIGLSLSSVDKVVPEAEGINWLSFEQLADSMKSNPKRVFVKIYADWCGPCKVMDKKTLSKERITEPLHNYYYSVAFNIEEPNPIKFKDSTFRLNPNLGKVGIHDLAQHIGKEAGTVNLPTIVILDENLDVLYKFPGFMSVLNLEEVLYLYKDLQK